LNHKFKSGGFDGYSYFKVNNQLENVRKLTIIDIILSKKFHLTTSTSFGVKIKKYLMSTVFWIAKAIKLDINWSYTQILV